MLIHLTVTNQLLHFCCYHWTVHSKTIYNQHGWLVTGAGENVGLQMFTNATQKLWVINTELDFTRIKEERVNRVPLRFFWRLMAIDLVFLYVTI